MSAPFVTNLGIGRRLEFGGEFGNQLFQIAAVLGYAQQHSLKPIIPPWKCNFSAREYHKFFPELPYGTPPKPEHILRQSNYAFSPLPRIENVDLRGTFQSPRYFPDEVLLHRILPPPEHISGIIHRWRETHNHTPFCALHFRFYDRVGIDDQPLVHTLPEHYYLRALKRVPNSLPLVLISNNPHKAALFAQRHLHGRKLLSSPPSRDPLIDFYALTHASEIIISNSTFGWWAGYLNKTAQRVLAPSRQKWLSFIARTYPEWSTSDIYTDRYEEILF